MFGLDYGWNSNFKEDNENLFRANSYEEALNIVNLFNQKDLPFGR